MDDYHPQTPIVVPVPRVVVVAGSRTDPALQQGGDPLIAKVKEKKENPPGRIQNSEARNQNRPQTRDGDDYHPQTPIDVPAPRVEVVAGSRTGILGTVPP